MDIMLKNKNNFEIIYSFFFYFLTKNFQSTLVKLQMNATFNVYIGKEFLPYLIRDK
jgi:hypothetical protein